MKPQETPFLPTKVMPGTLLLIKFPHIQTGPLPYHAITCLIKADQTSRDSGCSYADEFASLAPLTREYPLRVGDSESIPVVGCSIRVPQLFLAP